MTSVHEGAGFDVDPVSPTPAAADFLLGLDLGQARDYTALVIAQRHDLDPATYDVAHIERWKGERYPRLVEIVTARVLALRDAAANGRSAPRCRLVIDHTGVGRPVLDMFLEAALGLPVTGVTITSGQAISTNDDGFGVPKRVLASTLQVLLQSNRLRFAQQLPLTPTLAAELENFRVKINAGGHDSYGAGDDWRENNHDDLVLACALACWLGERVEDDHQSVLAFGAASGWGYRSSFSRYGHRPRRWEPEAEEVQHEA